MPVVSYRNNYTDLNNPNAVILQKEEQQKKIDLAFPKQADSFGQPGARSVHTMQLSINKYSGWMGKTWDDFWNWGKTPPSDERYHEEPPSAKILDARRRVADREKRLKTNLGIISFYIPTPMIYTNSIDYESTNLTDRVLNAASVTQGIGTVIGVGAEVAKLAGKPLNPKVEILFNNIHQREFEFEFLFAPVNEQETQELYKILKAIRAAAAPERSDDNIFWKAPNTFDIEFFHNGFVNDKIIKIDECVCTQIDVDYAPGGAWSTFHNGYPVATKMRIRFREREPNDRAIIEAGF